MNTNRLKILFKLDPHSAFNQNSEWVFNNNLKWLIKNKPDSYIHEFCHNYFFHE